MRLDDLLFWIKAVPFQPFRIYLHSGRHYDIRHPEMIRVGRSSAIIFSYTADPNPYESAEMVGLLLMERIEPIRIESAA
jgi:hypothetical protein